MISCTITIIPPGHAERQVCTITIVNDRTGDADLGNYDVTCTDTRGSRYTTRIERFRRAQDNGAQRLVAKAIDKLFPFQRENRYLHGEVSDRLAARDGWTTS